MATAPTVKYYYKQDTNQILVSGSDNKDGMNAMLTSSKNALVVQDILVSSKVKSIGQAVTYQSTAVYNTSSTEGFSIPINPDQELWVYRGIQPPNTSPIGTPPDAGMGDSNNTQYNAYLHRPYKLYLLVQTGSGTPTQPWLPFGNFFNDSTGNATGGGSFNFVNTFDLKQIDLTGNLNATANPFLVSQSRASGSFTIYGEGREVRPWVYTKYDSLGAPPAVGSEWFLYRENTTTNFTQSANGSTPVRFNTGTSFTGGVTGPGQNKLAFNNTTYSDVTEVYLSSNSTYGSGPSVWDGELTFLSQSIVAGKSAGQLIVYSDDPSQFVTFNISTLERGLSSPPNFWTMGVSYVSDNLGANFTNNATVTASLSDYSQLQGGGLSQAQTALINATVAKFPNRSLTNGLYTYTGSSFDAASANGQGASGSSQFGLYCQLDEYVQYKATVDASNGNSMRVTYTGSNFTPNFNDINAGENFTFTALAGTVSQSGVQASPSTFLLEVVNNTTTETTVSPTSVYASRIQDAYVSFSSSITNSLDGLYIFNQIPSEDIQVTASMFLNAWTGSDPGAAKYGETDVTYSISPDPPLYGAGEAGDKPTWQTCSINIYKGNFPNSIPSFTDTPLHTETFKDANIHVNGLAITTSFTIPSQSINFKDCIRLSLEVTSSQFEEVTSSLVVQEYYMEFRNNTASIAGEGLVPTSIDNAFQGTDGFSNAFDCQPLINNVVLDRTNNQIQLIEYTTNPYEPSNFQQILSGSAPRSTVPASNYLTAGWENSRYIGAETRADDVNTIVGAFNTFGDSPVIDYKRAYIAYCDQVIDPYPVLNRVTQFNIKYLINEGGDALNPRVSDYAAYDVEGTWDEDGIGRIGVNQVSGSSQYDQLNDYQVMKKVAKEPIPLLYSQVGANKLSNFIPIAGNASHIAVVTSSYIEYGMTAQGSNQLTGNDNVQSVTYFNLAQGIGTQTATIYPQSPGLFNSDNYNVTYSFGFAESSSATGTYRAAEGPIITASIGTYTRPSDGQDAGGNYPQGNGFPNPVDYYGNPGEVFFTTDPIGSGSGTTENSLSDQYQIRGTFTINSTMTKIRKTFKYYKGAGKKSKYSGGEIGDFTLWFESTVSDDLDLPSEASGGGDSWNRRRWDWTQNDPGQQDPTVTFFLGGNGQINGTHGPIALNEISNGGTWNNNHTEYYFPINEQLFKNYLDSQGIARNAPQFIQFNFPFQSDVDLQANTRYRFGGNFKYKNEDESTGDRRNKWNPLDTGTGDGETVGLKHEIVGTEAIGGPFTSMQVWGNRQASELVNNALNAPYWEIITGSATSGFDGFQYNILTNTGSGYPPTQTDPTAGKFRMNNQSGSLFSYYGGGSLNPNGLLTLPSTVGIGITNFVLGFQYAVVPEQDANPFSSFIATTDGSGSLASIQISTNNGGTQLASAVVIGRGRPGFKVGDQITISAAALEQGGFGANITSDVVITLTADNINFVQQGSSQIAISNTSIVSGQTLSASIAAVSASVEAGSTSEQIRIRNAYNSLQSYTGSINKIVPDDYNSPNWWLLDVTPNALSTGSNPMSPFQSSNLIKINFSNQSVTSTPEANDNIIELISPTGNENYGLGYYQGYLPYTASINPFFPGGFEPQDTAWPLPNVPWDIQPGDEIRFENNEALTYKITGVVTPQMNYISTGRNRLQLTLAGGPQGDGSIQSAVNIDFFLIRRYRYSPNTLIVDYPFPYGPLPTVREFVPSNDTIFSPTPAGGTTPTYPTSSTIQQSGSFVNYVKPLLKKDNTPTGIVLPEYPIDTLKVEPDEVIRDLRDKKLIE